MPDRPVPRPSTPRHPLRGALPPALLLAAIVGALSCSSDSTAPPADFSVDPATVELLVGATFQLSPVNAPGTVTWSSNAPDVAEVVPQTGFVTAVGSGTARITATSEGATAHAEVVVQRPPLLRLSEAAVEFDVTEGTGDPAPLAVDVTNGGDFPVGALGLDVQYAEGQPDGWLEAGLSGTQAPATLTLTPTVAGLEPGVYSAVASVTAPDAVNTPQGLPVTLRLVTPARIELSSQSVGLAAIPDAQVGTEVEITNGGGRPLTGLSATVAYGSGGADGWLSTAFSSPDAPTTLGLTASTASLEPGTYEATVTVASDAEGVDSRDIDVTLTVSPGPAIQLSATTVTLQALSGADAAEVQVEVTNGGGGTLEDLALDPVTYAGGQPQGWLVLSLDGSVAPTTLRVSALSSSLAEGTYNASFPVLSPVASNSPVTVSVSLSVGPPPEMSLSTQDLDFASFAGATIQPDPRQITITNSGGGQLTGLSASVNYQGGPSGWLKAPVFSSTTAPATMTVEAVTGGLPRGDYEAQIIVRNDVPGVTSRIVDVSFSISSFSQDVYPEFQADYGPVGGIDVTPCTGCHTWGGNSPNFDASAGAVHSALQSLITPGNPDAGRLVCKITAGSGCGSAMPLPSGPVARIKAWIAAGAPSG